MGIKQLYNDNLRKIPNEYGDVSVMNMIKFLFYFFILNLPLPPVMISATNDQFGHFFGLKYISARSQMYFIALKNTNIQYEINL